MHGLRPLRPWRARVDRALQPARRSQFSLAAHLQQINGAQKTTRRRVLWVGPNLSRRCAAPAPRVAPNLHVTREPSTRPVHSFRSLVWRLERTGQSPARHVE